MGALKSRNRGDEHETPKGLIVRKGTFMMFFFLLDGGKPSARTFVDILLHLLLEMAFRSVGVYCLQKVVR